MPDATKGTSDAEIAGQQGAGAQGDALPRELRAPEGLPTPLDALGRELLAVRSLALALVALADALLTTHRLAQLGDASALAVTLDAGTRDLLDVIRGVGSSAGGATPEPPRTFGARFRAPPDAPDVLHSPGARGDIASAQQNVSSTTER